MPRYEFRLPDIGEGLAEAELVRWLVEVGQTVKEDEGVVELMTDKAAVELPAPGAGVIIEIRVAEGAMVKTGSVLYVMDAEKPIGGMTADSSVGPAADAQPAVPAVTKVANIATTGAAAAAGGPLAPPAVRRLARELGVDLAAVVGTGPGGRISDQDVKASAEGKTSQPERTPTSPGRADSPVEGHREPLRGVRRRMAETMANAASTIPHVTGFHEIDALALMEMAERLKQRATAAGGRFPFDALLVRIAAIALASHPLFNSSLDEQAGEIVYHDQINVGLATATPSGLMVPVVRAADQHSLEELAAEVDRITNAAREGKIEVTDLQGATFTISNTGRWRGGHGTSLIRPPEVAIVGFGNVEQRAVVRGGVVVARPIMPVSVSFDHRLIDGEEGLGFALTLRSLIEGPEQIFLGA